MSFPKLPLLNKLPNWRTMLQLAGNKGIVHNIPFILYCTALSLIYITMNHYAENTIRRINETATLLKEDRWRYIDEKTQFMFLTKESQLEIGASALGLEKTKIPPFKIQISE
ncbi:MAG TPA: FtsL-like putative cell division protein [Chitinophagaceae bacterium]|jgi:hypothetical protein|nr:FtsL-like putative cell division protein [Chitinophagaceae bacterium]